jgi:hypothetical protein
MAQSAVRTTGDKLMKMILAGVTFAALLAAPAFAQSPRYEGPAAGINQQKQSRSDHRTQQWFARETDHDTRANSLCSMAHDFCPGFYGDND